MFQMIRDCKLTLFVGIEFHVEPFEFRIGYFVINFLKCRVAMFLMSRTGILPDYPICYFI